MVIFLILFIQQFLKKCGKKVEPSVIKVCICFCRDISIFLLELLILVASIVDLLKTENKCLKKTLYCEFELSKVSGEVHLIIEVLNKFTSPVFFILVNMFALKGL